MKNYSIGLFDLPSLISVVSCRLAYLACCKAYDFGAGMSVNDYCYIHPDHSEVLVTNNIFMISDFKNREDVSSVIIERAVPDKLSKAFEGVSNINKALEYISKRNVKSDAFSDLDYFAIKKLNKEINKDKLYLSFIHQMVAGENITGVTDRYDLDDVNSISDALHVDRVRYVTGSTFIGGGTELLKKSVGSDFNSEIFSVKKSFELSNNGDTIKLSAGDIIVTKQKLLSDNPIYHMSANSMGKTRYASFVYSKY